jgi:hypothetical protein
MTQGRRGGYWRYALGEAVLVILGILIALQIDNWNDDRIEQRQVREYALNLVGDLEADMAMLAPVAIQISSLMERSGVVAEYSRNRALADFDNATLFVLTDRLDYRPYGWNRSAIEQLKASGALRQMRNTELVKQISAYDALTHHLDQDYANDMAAINRTQALVNQLVDANYPANQAYEDWYLPVDEGTDEQPDWSAFQQQAFFKVLQAQRLPLLTEDVRELRVLANQMLEVGAALQARVNSEIPRLRGFAADINRLVDGEYR